MIYFTNILNHHFQIFRFSTQYTIGLLLIRNLQRQIRTARIIYLVEPDLETDGLFRPDCTLLSLKILK